MRGIRLNEEYARRRNNEDLKIAKSQEVEKYFDKWNKITSRYGQWTGPEYYQVADQHYREHEEKKLKLMNLEKRKEKLRKLLMEESLKHEQEIKDLERAKNNRLSVDMLRKLRETAKRTEEDKRKLDLESELYKRWRYESRENHILLESKSDNETLAKMNWLDQQIANQMQKENNEKETEERRIRYTEEARKREELLSARKQLRYDEISELQKLQETKIAEVRNYEQQLIELHKQETEAHRNLEQIQSEITKLNAMTKQRTNWTSFPHNFRRVKMLLRDRSDTIRNDLRQDIEMLKRIPINHQNQQIIEMLKEKFEMQYDLEIQKQSQIEAMYESEAKESLIEQQEIWVKESNKRIQHLQALLLEQKQCFQSEIDFFVRRQSEIASDRDSSRKLADETFERIRNVRKIDEEDDRISLVTDFAEELSEDVQENLTIHTIDSGRPKHGRKKVVWT